LWGDFLSMLHISRNLSIPEKEIQFSAVRAQGAGGQNVNKLATAIHLRFDIRASSLPEFYKERLLALSDHRITRDGVIVIKADETRSQAANKEAALARLQHLIRSAGTTRKKRLPTQPSRGARQKRVDEKTKRGRDKRLRKPPADD
jgi:ribosome-associated protein